MGGQTLNSKEYWNIRFQTDWDKMQGKEQTEFFSNVALSLFPEWIIHEIKRDNLLFCDVGCAFGDGVNILSKYFEGNFEGIDFSEEAINVAKSRFPQYNFEVGDITSKDYIKKTDIIFCSNVLEHFGNPWDIMKGFIKCARKYIILLIPFEEEIQIDEHEYKFLTNKVFINVNDFSLVYASSIDCGLLENTLYSDKQILLIYSADAKNIVTLQDLIGNVTTRKFDNLLSENEKDYLMEQNLLKEEGERIVKLLNEEKEKLNKDIENLKNILEDRNVTIKGKDNILYSLQRELCDKKLIIKDKDAILIRMQNHIDSLTQSNVELNNNNEYSKNIIYNLQIELQKTYQSFSWRATKIFRILGKLTYFSKVHYSIRNLRNERKKGFTYTELILYKIKNSGYYPYLQKITPNKIKHKISHKYNIPTDLQIQPYEKNLEMQLQDFVQKNIESKFIMIISGVKYVDNEGQRNIRLAHEAVKLGYKIIFIYWRWNSNEQYETSTENMFQMPLDYLYEKKCEIFETILHAAKCKIMLIEFPHLYANEIADYSNCNDWITIYDIIDDWEEFQKKGQAVWYDKKIETELANKVDIRIATAERLKNKISKEIFYKSPFYVISNGVDPNRMIVAQKKEEYCYNRGDLQIGYFGHLTDAWFDWKLIIEIANRRKNWTFHIIGYGEPEKLKTPENIKLYGKKEPSELPYFAAFWNVAIIPFIDCELTLSVNPIKIYEYLQFKLPVVTTNMPEVRNFPYTQITTGIEEFENAIENAVGIKIDNELIRDFVLANTWEQKLYSILDSVENFHPEMGYKAIYKDN